MPCVLTTGTVTTILPHGPPNATSHCILGRIQYLSSTKEIHQTLMYHDTRSTSVKFTILLRNMKNMYIVHHCNFRDTVILDKYPLCPPFPRSDPVPVPHPRFPNGIIEVTTTQLSAGSWLGVVYVSTANLFWYCLLRFHYRERNSTSSWVCHLVGRSVGLGMQSPPSQLQRLLSSGQLIPGLATIRRHNCRVTELINAPGGVSSVLISRRQCQGRE